MTRRRLKPRNSLLLVGQFLSYAELQAVEKRPMYMQQWVNKLDDFLRFNEKEILRHKGKVSRQDMVGQSARRAAKIPRAAATVAGSP
jgi:hypothetical protein